MPENEKRYNTIIDIKTDNEELTQQNTISHAITMRLYLIVAVIMCCYLVIIFRMLDIGIGGEIQEKINIISTNKRGDIFDRNGAILATSLPTQSIYAKPDQIYNIEEVVTKLSAIFCKYDYEKNCKKVEQDIAKKLSSTKNFVWLKRHILPEEQIKIKQEDLPGIYFSEEHKRFYPYENSFAHLIGFVDVDANGISGVEKYFNGDLCHNNITLSVDTRVQAIVHEKLTESIVKNDAIGGAVIIMNTKNGEIISMVSLPDFNPNGFGIKQNLNKEALFNRATLGVYEMGSTFKIITAAIAVDLGTSKFSDSFNVANVIKLGRFKIKDYKFHKTYLSFPEVLIFSSNRGMIQIANKFGVQKQQEYVKNLGMLNRVKIEVPEAGRPLSVNKKQWNDVYLATISYGHGIAVTGLHTVQAIGAVVNGGNVIRPTILKTNKEKVEGERVFKEETSATMRKLMRRIVIEGYAKKANVLDYDVIGKTGTAEKVKNGKYDKKHCNLVTFNGAFPMDDPQYVIFIAVDEPKPNKHNLGFPTGGMVAAPLAGEIIKDAALLLGVMPNNVMVFSEE